MDEKYLIIVDVQNDFIDGVLGTPEAQIAVNNLEKYLDKHSSDYDGIYASEDVHYESSYADTAEGKCIPLHCVVDSTGRKMPDNIAKYVPETNVRDKSEFSAGNIVIFDIMVGYAIEQYERRKNNIDEKVRLKIDIVGLCTDICVISTALEARSDFPEAEIRVIESCCAGTTPEKHKAALEVMKSCLIDVV